nr:PREDICTED: testicular acid phosphatase homolog [Bemisia tabaci]
MHGIKLPKTRFCLVIFLIVSTGIACVVGIYLLQRFPAAKSTLRFVSIIHRHGERSPMNNYPNDPYKGESFWPEGLHVLVQRGKESMFELGRFLRHRYDGFLSEIYRPSELSVVSSDLDRCIMSANLVLAGLYPPVKFQNWNPDLPWQPVPVHTLPDDCDNMIQFTKRCDLYSEEKTKADAFIQMSLDDEKEMLDYFSRATGRNLTTNVDVTQLYDNLLIVELHGMPLPEWAQGANLGRLKNFFDRDCILYFLTPEMIHLRSGVMLNEMLVNMKRKIDAKILERRFNLYSAHDTTIASIWRGMNISREIKEQPQFGAALILELHEIRSEYYVKILYKESSAVETLSVLKTGGCEEDQPSEEDGMCAFSTFSAALEPATIADFEKACRITS